jgi:hypothetical protein
MKIFGLSIFLFPSFFGFSQFSYDFSEALPTTEKNILMVSESEFGTYEGENGETVYEFNSEGVFIVSTVFSSISKETIRESSKYVVRNGFMFGVVANDSVPCVLDEDRYHFGVKNKEQIIGGTSKNILKKLNSNSYILNYSENGGFTPSLLLFNANGFTIQYFDYETGTKMFSVIKDQKTVNKEGMNYITLSPSKKEWQSLDKNILFGTKINYLLKK